MLLKAMPTSFRRPRAAVSVFAFCALAAIALHASSGFVLGQEPPLRETHNLQVSIGEPVIGEVVEVIVELPQLQQLQLGQVEVKRSCSCSSAVWGQVVNGAWSALRAGEAWPKAGGALKLLVDTEGKPGSFSEKISILDADSDQPLAVVTMSGRVDEFMALHPSPTFLGIFRRGEVASVTGRVVAPRALRAEVAPVGQLPQGWSVGLSGETSDTDLLPGAGLGYLLLFDTLHANPGRENYAILNLGVTGIEWAGLNPGFDERVVSRAIRCDVVDRDVFLRTTSVSLGAIAPGEAVEWNAEMLCFAEGVGDLRVQSARLGLETGLLGRTLIEVNLQQGAVVREEQVWGQPLNVYPISGSIEVPADWRGPITGDFFVTYEIDGGEPQEIALRFIALAG